MKTIIGLATILAVAIGLATIVAIVSVAWAQSPHFIGVAQIAGVFSDGGISASFKEAGLGDSVLVTYELAGKFSADYGCVNHGGNHPQAANKEALVGDVGAIATFQSGKNGNVVGTVTFVPPPASAELSCPGNQVAILADISYSDLTLEDVTNGDFATLDKVALSAVFFTF